MTRTFIETPLFSKQWKDLGFGEEDLRNLQNEILKNLNVGKIMEGTGGVRKMRYAFEKRGKSGSSRVCYVDFEIYETIYLITAYSKKDKENLSKEERNIIRKLVKQLEDEVKRRYS